MKQPWICALCLIAITAVALPLHAQSTPSVKVAAAYAADFLSTLPTPPAPPAPLPWLPATCTVTQCKDRCTCGAGCDSVCTSLTICSCTCKSTHVPPVTCRV